MQKHQKYFHELTSFKIMIYGKKSVDLINHLSIRDITKLQEKDSKASAFYTVLMKKKKFIDEVIIINLSPYKYLIITKNIKTLKYFNKLKHKYELTTVNNVTSEYSLFTLHNLYNTLNNRNIYQVTLQNYKYHILLSYSYTNYKTELMNYGFKQINIEKYNHLLYNNNVITNFKFKNKLILLNILKSLYNADNHKFKCRPLFYKIKQYEATQNFVPCRNQKIYDSFRKKIGFIHPWYRNDNKKYPFVIAVIRDFKDSKMVIIKDKVLKKEIILKERFIVNK